MGELVIDYPRRRVTLEGRALSLTGTEYRLLCELALHAGRTLSLDHLMGRVWSARESTDSRVVRAYMKRLRRKLGETAANPTYIFNQPRVGYRLGQETGDWDAEDWETGDWGRRTGMRGTGMRRNRPGGAL